MSVDGREPELDPDEIQTDQVEAPEPQRPDLDERQLAGLAQVLRGLYPHPQFPDGPYQRCAEAVRDGAQTDLVAGLARVDELAGGPFADADEATVRKVVDDLGQEDEFLLAVHAVAVNTLYDDHEVWDLLGYEGASFDKGGYLNRGFNDLDWLPDPRITEYEGEARVELVALKEGN